jgi:hypothetical protein
MAAVWTSALAELPALLLPGDRKTPSGETNVSWNKKCDMDLQ